MTRLFPEEQLRESIRLNPYWSTWSCFAEVVTGKKYLRYPTIKKYFLKYVDKKDYTGSSKSQLLGYLCKLAKKDTCS